MATLLDKFRRRAKSEGRDVQLREHYSKLKPRSDAQAKAREVLSTPKKKMIRPGNNHLQAPNTEPMARRALFPQLSLNGHRPERAVSPPSHQPNAIRLPSLPNGKTRHPRGRKTDRHRTPVLGVRPREYHSYEEYVRPVSRSLPPVPRRQQMDASELRALREHWKGARQEYSW